MNRKLFGVGGILSIVAVLVLLTTLTVQAQQASTAAPSVGKVITINLDACKICFTCGSFWNNFGGIVRSWGDQPFELGSGCSGGFATRSDSSPFLCCK